MKITKKMENNKIFQLFLCKRNNWMKKNQMKIIQKKKKFLSNIKKYKNKILNNKTPKNSKRMKLKLLTIYLNKKILNNYKLQKRMKNNQITIIKKMIKMSHQLKMRTKIYNKLIIMKLKAINFLKNNLSQGHHKNKIIINLSYNQQKKNNRNNNKNNKNKE